jgi:Rieske Fe-S protein
MSELNRREFVAVAAAACASCMMGRTAWAAEPGPVDAGPIGDYKADGVFDKFAKSHGFLLVRRDGRLYAPTSTCTHKAQLVLPNAETGNLVCTKHGSTFSLEGRVIKGPATLPLPRFGISLDARQHVIVDTSRRFIQAQWNQAGAFIKV